MTAGRQAVLPLWGNGASAQTVRIIATGHFSELCDEFVVAESHQDEATMDSVCDTMREVVQRVEKFKRERFRKWAKERESDRR